MQDLKERTKCVICRKQATAGSSLRTDCGHWTHNQCLQELGAKKDYGQCARCRGLVDEAVRKPLREPVTNDGKDYVLHPPSASALKSLRSAATSVLQKLRGVPSAKSAFSLLSQGPYQMPVERIITDYELGLQHMIKQGVTIDDFLQHGYTLDDLMLFQDLSGERGQERARQALCALKMTADHLREYGDTVLPVERLREEYGVTPAIISSRFGLRFPEGGFVLSSPASEDWTAVDVLNLGYSMQDLIEHAGMEYVEQYEELYPSEQDEKELNATLAHLDQLLTMEHEEETPIAEHDPEVGIASELPTPLYVLNTFEAPEEEPSVPSSSSLRTQEPPLEPLRAHRRTRHRLK